VERVSRRTQDSNDQRRLLTGGRTRGTWVTAVVVLVLVTWLVQAALRSHFIDFSLVRKYQFSPLVMRGVRNTLIVSILAQAIGIALGVLAALVRISKNPVAAAVSSFYI